MERVGESGLPPHILEMQAQMPSRAQELAVVARCIGCTLARAEKSGEEALISTSAIATCNGFSEQSNKGKKMHAELCRLEATGILETWTPEELPPAPTGGTWEASYTRFFRSTAYGRRVFVTQEQSDYNLRNPFARLTPTEERVLTCARCILAGVANKDNDSDFTAGFTARQIADCQKMALGSVSELLRGLHTEDALERTPTSPPLSDKAKFLYFPTPETAPWLSPKNAENCQTPEIAKLPVAHHFLQKMTLSSSPPGSHPAEASTSTERTAQMPEFVQAVRCISCLVGRKELISTASIATCNDRPAGSTGYERIRKSIRWLKAIGMIREHVPDELPKMPPWGYWFPDRTRYYQLTDFGRLVIPARPQEQCPVRNPFARLNSDQARIIKCFRCVLARTADAKLPTAGGVIAQQIAECQQMRYSKPADLLKRLYDEGLLDKKSIPRIVPGKGLGPSLFWPTTKGAPWLAAEKSKDCSGIEWNWPSLDEEFTADQQRILNCLACITQPDTPGNCISHMAIIKCVSLPQVIVSNAFKKLTNKGYLEKRLVPGQRAAGYFLTARGRQLLTGVRLVRRCSPLPLTAGTGAELLHGDTTQLVATPQQQAVLMDFWDNFDSFCASLSKRHGEDIAQNVRLKFLTQVTPTVRDPNQIRAWLFTAARRENITRSMREKRTSAVAPEASTWVNLADPDQNTEVAILRDESAREAVQVIDLLSRLLQPDQWWLIQELYVKGRTQAEVAADLECTANAIAARKVRIWKAIQRIVEEQEDGKASGRAGEKLPITLVTELIDVKKAQVPVNKERYRKRQGPKKSGPAD